MEETQAYTDNIMDRGLGRLTDTTKSPVQTALLKLNITLSKLGEETDRLGNRTASARSLVPTENTQLNKPREELGSPLFAELSRMNAQAEHILKNLQNIISEIEL